MTATSENFGDLISPGFYKIFTKRIKEPEAMLQDLYGMRTSTKSQEKDSSVGQFSDFDEFTGTVAYSDLYQGYDKTFNFTEYAKGFKIERKLWDDDLTGIMNKKPANLAEAASRTREKHGFSVFNEAFTTVSTSNSGGGGDGLELCGSAHPSNAPGVSTQSNEGTTALSVTAVEATRRLGRDMRGDQYELLDVQYDTIITPIELEQTAWEIINSKGKIDTSVNNANFHQGKYKLIVCPRLTDATDWFMVDSKLMKDMLLFWDRIKPEFFQDKDSDTLIAKFVCYMRYGFGWNDWRFIFGQLVT